MSEFDVAVVGGGIVGSWTAFHLLRAKKNVVLLEQFEQPHTNGSSHGQTRLTRTAYAQKHFAQLMPVSHRLWRRMEEETGEQLMVNCGVLNVATKDEDVEEYEACLKNLEEYAPDGIEKGTPKIRELFDRRLNYPVIKGAFIDKTGGVLFAHKSVLAIQDLFVREGGHLWNQHAVEELIPVGDKVRIRTSLGDVTASSVVITAGAWTSRLIIPKFLPSLPLEPQVVRVYYWKEKEPGVYSPAAGFPAVLDLRDESSYAIPSIEYPGFVKACRHGGVPCDPDHRDLTPQDPNLLADITEYVQLHFPLLEPEPAIIETCMYTTTFDEDFIVDTLPLNKNIIVGAGFSGTGFKTSPAVGLLLSELAQGKTPSLDISAFSLSRFIMI